MGSGGGGEGRRREEEKIGGGTIKGVVFIRSKKEVERRAREGVEVRGQNVKVNKKGV